MSEPAAWAMKAADEIMLRHTRMISQSAVGAIAQIIEAASPVPELIEVLDSVVVYHEDGIGQITHILAAIESVVAKAK